MSEPRLWTKHYADASGCARAVANYRWLVELAAPVPELHVVEDKLLGFATFRGRHVLPADLPRVAQLLGRLHRNAYLAELHQARLDRPFRTLCGLVIPDFLAGRQDAILARLHDGSVPDPACTADEAISALETALAGPACFYKDSNPRNFLIGSGTTVIVDFDALTLAPLGYDLAKLIVTLAMTHGPHVTELVEEALTSYNAALTDKTAALPPVSRSELMIWAAIHHVLTSPYLGRGGYRHAWSQPQTL